MVSSRVRAAVLAGVGAVLAACGDEDSQETASVAEANRPPVISGDPVLTVMEGESYEFVPKASDPDGDALVFHVSGKPAWMEFDSQSGRLSGHPQGKDVGKHRGIVVSVSDGEDEAVLDPMDVEVVADSTVANEPPQISGTPPDRVLVGMPYSFTPAAQDAEDDPLSFSIANQPSWATFAAASGTLAGTPAAEHVGTYSGISITVSDGSQSATLGPFSIAVDEVANGTATLSWLPPTENTDGSPLEDLAGYVVYWGTDPGDYFTSETIADAGVTSHVVDNLPPGFTYYFSLTAFNSDGLESAFSNEANKTIP